ncbi:MULTISPECIES: ABC transporter ATP-binding protein [Kytococcus]|uniref:ABC transporter ATP-binding protein n=1 Tax=Kytococcus TaxID=57499 RepID=UPI001EDB9029|nr:MULTISPECIES: ABC transporter ATP-binding protein [Kytococcus]
MERLEKSFVSPGETVRVLDGVTFSVESGECVALTGASGSGKSTLLNILAGLEQADAGSARVAGVDVVAASEADRARMRLEKVGLVFQDHNLVPDFTVLENVEVVLRARGMDGRAARRAALDALDRVSVADLAGRVPARISGGQAQRVGIARAIAGGKQVVLADEPTGSLDSRTTESVFELLADLARDGAAVVVCTHDLSVRDHVSREYHLVDGSFR